MKSISMAAGLVLLSAGAASAAPITMFGYDFSASVQAASAPSYQGSKRYSVFPSGNLAITRPWAFDDFAAPDDSATLAVYNNQRFSFGAAAAVISNRGNSHELEGMRNIGYALQGGGFMNFWPVDWVRLHVEALKGLVSEDGVLVNTGADLVTQQGKWRFSGGPRFSWADGHYNGTYFGVTSGEAALSPRFNAAYHAGAGPLSAGLEAATEYKLTSRWRLTLSGNYDRLLSQDADSPLVSQVGTADQFSVAAGVRFMLTR